MKGKNVEMFLIYFAVDAVRRRGIIIKMENMNIIIDDEWNDDGGLHPNYDSSFDKNDNRVGIDLREIWIFHINYLNSVCESLSSSFLTTWRCNGQNK